MRFTLSAAVVALLLLPTRSFAAIVRTDRPRMLFAVNNSGPGTTVAEYRRRCMTDPAYMGRCQGGLANAHDSSYPAIAQAAGYIVTGDATRCTAAYTELQRTEVAGELPRDSDPHGFISDHGRSMANLTVALDWCYAALSDPQKQWIVDRIVLYADWYLAHPAPDVFHDDMNNVWNSIALAGLALKGTSADTQAIRYLAAAETQWKTVIIPALEYAGDWWHEGFVYVQPTIGSLAWYALAWSTATDENMFAYAQSHGDLFEGYLRFHAYAMRPDYNYVYVGDTTFNKQSIELFSRSLIDMMTIGSRSTLGQALSTEIRTHSRPGYDYAGVEGWQIALFYDAARDATATPRTTLPTARWLGRGSQDVAVMRSGWSATDDTYVWMVCGDYMSAHQHEEVGSFQIFRNSMLTGPTGDYDSFDTDHWQNYYSQHSVHANTLAIYQPNEYFPTVQTLGDRMRNVNDGGERNLRMASMGSFRGVPDLATYRSRLTGMPHYETGNMETLEHGMCHDYVACNITAAYNSPGVTSDGNTPKVTEVTRQLVFLRPDTVVVFDRIEATDAAYDKRFLLHGITRPTIAGRTFSITNGPGRLLGQTVLPAMADTNIVDNFEVAGVAHRPSTMGPETGSGSRIEVSPMHESARDYFLHVMRATTATDTTYPSATSTEDANRVTMTMTDARNSYTLSFAKTGAMGGHLSVRPTMAGGTMCDQDLGANPIPPGDAGVVDGGVSVDSGIPDAALPPTDSAVRTDTGSDADGGTTGRTGGCGCGVVTNSRVRGFGAIALGFVLTARRRRSRAARLSDSRAVP